MKKERKEMTEKYRKDNQPYDIDVIPITEHQTRTTRVINKAIVLALIAVAISLGIFFMWSFQPTPLVVNNSPFPTRSIPPIAGANDIIVLEIDYCKNTDKQANVRTSYVSRSREIFMPVVKEQYDQGCSKEEVPILIPTNIPADTYKLKFVATYNLNPLQENVQVTFESQEFVISDNGTKVPNE